MCLISKWGLTAWTRSCTKRRGHKSRHIVLHSSKKKYTHTMSPSSHSAWLDGTGLCIGVAKLQIRDCIIVDDVYCLARSADHRLAISSSSFSPYDQILIALLSEHESSFELCKTSVEWMVPYDHSVLNKLFEAGLAGKHSASSIGAPVAIVFQHAGVLSQ